MASRNCLKTKICLKSCLRSILVLRCPLVFPQLSLTFYCRLYATRNIYTGTNTIYKYMYTLLILNQLYLEQYRKIPCVQILKIHQLVYVYK
jgi:hypothetical protein